MITFIRATRKTKTNGVFKLLISFFTGINWKHKDSDGTDKTMINKV